ESSTDPQAGVFPAPTSPARSTLPGYSSIRRTTWPRARPFPPALRTDPVIRAAPLPKKAAADRAGRGYRRDTAPAFEATPPLPDGCRDRLATCRLTKPRARLAILHLPPARR